MTRLAWRLARRRAARLTVLAAFLAVGAAFLAAGDAVVAGVGRAVAGRARELLAADLELAAARPLTPAARAALADLAARGARVTETVSFPSMLSAARPGAAPRLADVLAVEPAYPFYGAVLTEPPSAFARLFTGDACLVDGDAARQHALKPGDAVRLGTLTLTVAGVVTKESGRAMARFGLGPRVFIARGAVERAGLAGFGARLWHAALVALPPSPDPERAARDAAEALERRLDDPYLRVTSYPEAEPTTRQALGRLTSYFTLTALATFLLGAGGMAAGLSALLDEEMETAALLRCLGLGAAETARVYRVVCLLVGAEAGLLGALGGWALGWGALLFVRRFVGLELPLSGRLDPGAALEALAASTLCAVAVSEARVRALARVPPLEVLRERSERLPPTPRGTAVLLAASAAGVYAYLTWKTRSPETARWFTAAMAGTAAALTAGAWAALRLLRGLAEAAPLGAAGRLGLRTLARRPARAVATLFTLAAGFGLLGALDLVRHSLAVELEAGRAEGRPDHFLVDVQRPQLAAVRGLARRFGRGEPAFAPLVRARLASVNGAPVGRRPEQGLTQEELHRQRFLLREFNLTYADTLNPSETLTTGRFWASGETRGVASLEEGFSKSTGLRLGDRLVFDVQGRPVEATVTSLRKVDWLAMRPNFFVALPTALLERAPQYFVGAVDVHDGARSDEFRRALAAAAPNVSVIDTGQTLAQVSEILRVLLAALKGLAWFCVGVGLLVLAEAAAVGHRERRRDVALLRALGAGTRFLAAADLWAFGASGLATFILGAGASYGLGAALAHRLDVPFAPDAPGLAVLLGAALLLPAAAGLAACLPAYAAAPLETLRRDE